MTLLVVGVVSELAAGRRSASRKGWRAMWDRREYEGVGVGDLDVDVFWYGRRDEGCVMRPVPHSSLLAAQVSYGEACWLLKRTHGIDSLGSCYSAPKWADIDNDGLERGWLAGKREVNLFYPIYVPPGLCRYSECYMGPVDCLSEPNSGMFNRSGCIRWAKLDQVREQDWGPERQHYR